MNSKLVVSSALASVLALGLLSQAGTGDEILNLLLDALLVQLMGFERVDRGLNGALCDRLRAVGITPGVQDLHANLAVRFHRQTVEHTALRRLCEEITRPCLLLG